MALSPVHTTGVHGPWTRAVNTGSVDKRPCLRPVFTGVNNVNSEHDPWARVSIF